MRDLPPHVTAMLSALKFSDARREGLRTLTDSEWKDLLSRWGILRLMVPLRQVCGDDIPEWVRSRIDQSLAGNAERFERIKVCYSEFVDALRDRSAEHLVVKGFALCPGFVEHPRFRLQSDIDVYCPPESISHALDALSHLGYEPARGINFRTADHLPTMVRKTTWKWRGNYYDPDMPVSFELHFCFWNENLSRLRPKGLDEFWRRRVERRVDNLVFPALAPADNLAHSALIALRDALRGPMTMHLVYELARFLHANAENEQFWKSWRHLHDDSLRCLEVVSFRLASHCFACRLSEEIEKEIDSLPTAVHGWFGKYADSPLAVPFRPNKDALWLHLSLLQSSRDKRAVLFIHLLPKRLPSVAASFIQSPAKDGQKSLGTVQKRVRYAAFLVSRAAYHARVVPPTLWHGVRLWWSTADLGRGFLTFLAASFFFDFGMYIFFFLYNLYLLDRGFRENFLGLMTSAMTIGGVVGTIPAGMLAQRFGLRKTLIICLTLVSLVSALRLVFVAETPLLVLAFLAGSASAIWAVALSPTIAQLTNERNRPLGFSVVFAFGIAVGILGGQAGGRMPGWLMHMSLLVTAARAKEMALLLACGVIALAIWPASCLRFASSPVREKKTYPRDAFLFRFLVAIAVWSLAIGAFSPFFSVYFFRYLQMPVRQMGTIYSISHISQLLAMLAAPVIFRKFGLATGIVCSQVATAIALGCLARVSGTSAATTIYMAYVAFQWMSEPGMFSLLMNHVAPAEQTGASALTFLAINSSQAIAAAVAGASFVRFGYPVVLSVTAGTALFAALLFRLLLGKHSLRSSQSSLANLEI